MVGTSGKIVWKLRNVWKSLESMEIDWSFECFRNFVRKMSGNFILTFTEKKSHNF